tara:strand:+ start:319 stop:1554 length:1236 start_codon:yes stop_codon:yes gene_type:complete
MALNIAKMKAKNLFGFFAAVLAFAFLLPGVQAFGDIVHVVVDSSDAITGGENIALFADDSLDLRVVFDATDDQEDVRVTARILGEPGVSDITGRFDVLANRRYSRHLTLNLPNDIDPAETFVLEVTVESNSEQADELTANLQIQRQSYTLEILSVESSSSVSAGSVLGLNVVVKNRGRQESEDTFVEASIAELGISGRIFLGDLTPEDTGGLNAPERDDSAQGTIWLNIPSDAPAGLYTIEVEAFNDDSSTTVTRRVEVGGTGASSSVLTSRTTQTFAAGVDHEYTFTIVNSGDSIRVYSLIPEVDNGLTIDLDETIVAVPAGSSMTVKLTASAVEEGNYNFMVNVHGSDGELVGTQDFVANVEGKSVATGSAAVILTIVLAVIFVVLLIVLIVLLTRKTEKTEEFGESYY